MKNNIIICLLLCNLIVTIVLTIHIFNYKIAETPPVEESEIDSLVHRNDTLVIIIDSLKHEKEIKIEDAKNANDSVTLSLWYELLKS